MKLNQFQIAFVCISTLLFTSCQKEVEDTVYGCTIDYALNYNPDAEATDGSCKYPSLYQLSSIKLVQFPVLDGTGAPWDPSDAPDFHFEFKNNQNVLIYGSSTVDNVVGNYTWNLNPTPYIDVDTNLYFNLQLFEDDAGGSVIASWVNPYFYTYTANGNQSPKYPEVMSFVDDSVIIELHGSWIE